MPSTQATTSSTQWGQVNLFVFQGAYYQLITSMFIHASIVPPRRQHALPLHIRFARRRNVFVARIPRNLPCRRLSRQRSLFSVWTILYFSGSFRRNLCPVRRMRNLQQTFSAAINSRSVSLRVLSVLHQHGAGVNILAHLGGLGLRFNGGLLNCNKTQTRPSGES